MGANNVIAIHNGEPRVDPQMLLAEMAQDTSIRAVLIATLHDDGGNVRYSLMEQRDVAFLGAIVQLEVQEIVDRSRK